MKVTNARKIVPIVTASSSKLQLSDYATLLRFVGVCPNREVCAVRRSRSVEGMFNIAIEILIDKLCNMHVVPVGAWDIGLIPVKPMATQPRFQGTSIDGIAILCSFGARSDP